MTEATSSICVSSGLEGIVYTHDNMTGDGRNREGGKRKGPSAACVFDCVGGGCWLLVGMGRGCVGAGGCGSGCMCVRMCWKKGASIQSKYEKQTIMART